jgi:glycosyltransferase involved in cell wall biosynthesis
MKVLVMADQLRRPVPGGIGTYVRGLLGGLSDIAQEPERMSSNGRLELSTWASRPATPGNDPLRTYGSVRVSRLSGRSAQLLWDLGLSVAPSDRDWCHATSLSTPGVRKSSPPLSTFVHDLAWITHPDSFTTRGRRWHQAALKRAIERSTVLAVPSEQTAQALADVGVEPSVIDIIEEGCDHLPLVERRKGTHLLSVSTIEPRKNLSRLIEAYARIRPLLPEPWPLKIVGPNGWGDLSLPSSEGVEFVGRVDDQELAELLAGARALAYVPLLEGWGLPVGEAMRAGVPVVSSDVPAAMGSTCLVDPLDVDDVARGLREVLTDDALRADLVRQGSAIAAEFTWARTAQGHLAMWETR